MRLTTRKKPIRHSDRKASSTGQRGRGTYRGKESAVVARKSTSSVLKRTRQFLRADECGSRFAQRAGCHPQKSYSKRDRPSCPERKAGSRPHGLLKGLTLSTGGQGRRRRHRKERSPSGDQLDRLGRCLSEGGEKQPLCRFPQKRGKPQRNATVRES